MKTMFIIKDVLVNRVNWNTIKLGVLMGLIVLGMFTKFAAHPEQFTHSIGTSEVVEMCYVNKSGVVVGVQNDRGFDSLAKEVRTHVSIDQCADSISVR